MSSVYVDEPRILEALQDNIRQEMAATRPEKLQKVMENDEERARYGIRSEDDCLRVIIYKKKSERMYKV